MKLPIVYTLLLLHISLVIICIYLMYWRRAYVQKEYIVPIILLPFFGPFMVFVIDLLNTLGMQGKKPLNVDLLTPDEDILWKALKSYHENGNIVPLEEAILINDIKVRRKFMLETLYEDPLKYLDILMLAKNNEDVETSHYATTTISRAQREFQVAIQNQALEVENQPDDLILLDRYIETLGKYIESGLLEEHLLRNLQITYKEVLDKKLDKVQNDKHTLILKLRNNIDLHDYASALSMSNVLKKYWPEDEQTWIEALRVCVEGKDHERLSEVLREISKTNFIWTKEGKEQVSAWVDGMS